MQCKELPWRVIVFIPPYWKESLLQLTSPENISSDPSEARPGRSRGPITYLPVSCHWQVQSIGSTTLEKSRLGLEALACPQLHWYLFRVVPLSKPEVFCIYTWVLTGLLHWKILILLSPLCDIDFKKILYAPFLRFATQLNESYI